MSKCIEISVFRVSSDSKYLDMIFKCPEYYHFTGIALEVRRWNPESKLFDTEKYYISEEAFESSSDEDNISARLPLSALGIFEPAIYVGTFTAELDEYDPEKYDYQEEWTEEDYEEAVEGLDSAIEDHAVCSDINDVYKCILDGIEDTACLTDCGAGYVPDDVIMKYLVLWGHTAALWNQDMDAAERYFRMLSSCFRPCGCGGCGCKDPRPAPRPNTKSNCGCGK